MADEQGTGRPDGNFARKAVGSAVNDILDNVGRDGRRFTPRESPPTNPEVGDTYLADGTNWDPNNAGSPDLVVYDTSDGWSSIVTL